MKPNCVTELQVVDESRDLVMLRTFAVDIQTDIGEGVRWSV